MRLPWGWAGDSHVLRRPADNLRSGLIRHAPVSGRKSQRFEGLE